MFVNIAVLDHSYEVDIAYLDEIVTNGAVFGTLLAIGSTKILWIAHL